MNEKKKSFLSSLRGIITITISAVAALGALLGSLNAIGIFDEEVIDEEKGVAITVNIEGKGGTTNPIPGLYIYPKGTLVSITAMPNTGFELERWTGDFSGTSTILNIEADRDMTITAHFKSSSISMAMPTPAPTLTPSPTTTPAPTPTPSPTTTPSSAAEVVFPDSYLETAIRSALGNLKGSITVSALEQLISLEVINSKISDLTGLEYCTSLKKLAISGERGAYDRISDISPLSSLTNLIELNISISKISDIAPLSNLTNLTTLILWNADISDISPLSSLTNLTELNLFGNDISDISPLSSLIYLKKLDLAYNQISNIAPLVENDGLSTGDVVKIQENNLDLSEASEDLGNIRILEERGVEVYYLTVTQIPIP